MNKLIFPPKYGLGYGQKILKGEEGFKSPMLVVGANTFIREHVSNAVLKEWDLHLLFFPCSAQVWQVGILQLHRSNNSVILNLNSDTDVKLTIIEALKQLTNTPIELHPKALVWLTKSVYKCPKLSLKDILHLEPYKNVA